MERKHQNWFDENEIDIKKLINKLHRAHKDHLEDKTSSKKEQDYQRARLLQQKLQKRKNNWGKRKL